MNPKNDAPGPDHLADLDKVAQLAEAGKLAQAERLGTQIIKKAGPNADIYYLLACVAEGRGRDRKAESYFIKACETDDSSEFLNNNFGVFLQKHDRFEEAEVKFRRAIEIDPGYLRAIYNLGGVLEYVGRSDEAIACYEQVLDMDPALVEARNNLSRLLIRVGRLEEGWAMYDSRVEMSPEDYRRAHDAPLWQGEHLLGKTILVTAEQGVGDEIIYLSMVPDLLDRGATVVMEADPRLRPLFRRSFPNVTFIKKITGGRHDGHVDYRVRAGSLGQHLRASFDAFPEPKAYLQADAALTERLRERYLAGGAAKIAGISWHSSSAPMGAAKSVQLDRLQEVLEIPGIRWVNMQYGDTERETRALVAKTGIELIRDPDIDAWNGLDDFAAQISALDFFVSVSNSSVHMAGALGVPTLCLLSVAPHHYWFEGHDSALWYPSVKFGRQRERHSWDDVIDWTRDEVLKRVAT